MPMPPNLQQMLKQAQQMQEEMEAAQAALKDERVEASSGGGMVKVVATGDGKLESLVIDPDAVDPEDVELLQDMVMAAVNEAMRQAEELRERSLSGAANMDALGGAMEMLGGGGLPGMGAPPAGNRAARRAGKKKK